MTLRELASMAQARVGEQWSHTSALLALLANIHRDPRKGRTFKPADFDPTRPRHGLRPRKTKEPLPIVGIHVLKQVFVDRIPTSHRKESS